VGGSSISLLARPDVKLGLAFPGFSSSTIILTVSVILPMYSCPFGNISTFCKTDNLQSIKSMIFEVRG